MLKLEFEGYYQMRMATDPDPTDDPRGVSGYTFALPGEPDFDQLIHLQPDEPGVYQREYGDAGGPVIGVTVRRASVGDRPVNTLVGARVALVGAKILENNGLLVRNDFFMIDPILVQVRQGKRLLLERRDILNPEAPHSPVDEATAPMILRRQPKRFVPNSLEVAAATRLHRPGTQEVDASNETLIANRRERRDSLHRLLESLKAAKGAKKAARGRQPEDERELRIEGLITRIRELEIVTQWWNLSQQKQGHAPIDRRAYMLGMQCAGWDIDVNGPAIVGPLPDGYRCDTSVPWPLRFWMGGWDGDALCAYIKGSWEIPLV
jgi:hypothetical protein